MVVVFFLLMLQCFKLQSKFRYLIQGEMKSQLLVHEVNSS